VTPAGSPRWVEVPGAAAVREGFVRSFVVDGFPLAIARAGGRLHAVEDRCSHDDGPLGEGTLDGCEVICPRHGARFDVRDGRVTRMPAARDILSVAVREEDGRVLVDAGAL
jgi:3-phenylpropionate/trans-cinnamate dioxygenase ferredoxin subunit